MNKIKEQFPIFSIKREGRPLIYFDSAATAQKPSLMIDGMNDFYREQYGTVHRAIYELSVEATALFQEVRLKLKKFLNAKLEEEIIFTRGTTESINLVAYSFSRAFMKEGDEILISAMEHHSNIVPWQMVAEERGLILKVAPYDEKGILDLEAFEKLLTPKTKIVAITHVSNALGTVNPIKEIVSMAKKVGAKVLVDGAQAAPHRAIDVEALGVDFYVFSGHKLYGPTGIGVLFGKADLLNQMPPYQGGGDMIEKVTFEKTTYNVLPMKFEAGTPMIAEVIGLGKAIDFIESIGFQKIEEHEQILLKYGTEKLLEINGLKIIGNAPLKGGIISFIIDGVHPLDVGTLLDLKNIAIRTGHLCCQPIMDHYKIPGVARVSFGIYNEKEEIDTFIKALKEVKEQLVI